jgi:hypothetical protein
MARGGPALVALITLIGAAWLGSGAADPPVVGSVVWSDQTLTWAGGPEMTLTTNQDIWFVAPSKAALPNGAFTLTVQARLSPDVGAGAAWGVWLETADGRRVIYAISSEGYTTTRACDSPSPAIEDCPALRPEWRWLAYPRIHPPGDANTITLHVERPGCIRLRINREIMGIAPIPYTEAWGVWARGGRAANARLIWERAQIAQ